VLDHDDQTVEGGEPVGGGPQLIGMGHQLEEEVLFLQVREHTGVGERPGVPSHGTDAPEA